MKKITLAMVLVLASCTSTDSKTGSHSTKSVTNGYTEFWADFLEAKAPGRTPAQSEGMPKDEAFGVIYYESIGSGKKIMNAGHAAVYLSHYCSDNPLQIRRCTENDKYWGVVVARYAGFSKKVKYDFMAFPFNVHTFGTQDFKDSPILVTGGITKLTQDKYWSDKLQGVLPKEDNIPSVDSENVTELELKNLEIGQAPLGRWRDAVASSHRRDLFFMIARADKEQSEAIAKYISGLDNISHFNAFLNNCANFASNVKKRGGIGGGRGLLADMFLVTPGSVAKAFRDHYQDKEKKQNFESDPVVARTVANPDPFLRVMYIPQFAGSREASGSPHSLFAILYKNKLLWPAAPFLWKAMVLGFVIDKVSKPFNSRKEYKNYGSPEATQMRYEIMKLNQDMAANPSNKAELKARRDELAKNLQPEMDRFFGKDECWDKTKSDFKALSSELVSKNVISKEEEGMLFGNANVNKFPKKFEGANVEPKLASDGFVLKVDGREVGLTRNNILNYDKVGAARVMLARVNYDLFNKSENRRQAQFFDEDWNLMKTTLSNVGINTNSLVDSALQACSN